VGISFRNSEKSTTSFIDACYVESNDAPSMLSTWTSYKSPTFKAWRVSD